MNRPQLVFAATTAALLVFAIQAQAQHLIPGPGEDGYDSALDARVDGHERVLHGIMALPLGFGLEAFVSAPADRAAVDAFVASGEHDFMAATGRHPYEVVDLYEENGDLGMFGGVQAAGDAFRYATLRDSGAAPADVDLARTQLLRAMEGLHWQLAVTGQPGVLARGIRRISSEPGEPPVPRPAPETTPLHDSDGNPLPADKGATWRDDFSGELPFLVWVDDCSKDQLDGYVFALGAIWEAVREDSSVDASLRDRLQADARDLAHMLMVEREVAPGVSLDLTILDADGRNTTFHDLNAREVAPGATLPRPINGFNALMALSVMRTLYEITGDEDIGRFYYDTLVEDRGYPDVTESNVGIIYVGPRTNYSNLNMAFVAAYGVLRYESDPDLARHYRRILTEQLYEREGGPQGMKQSFFDLIYAGFRAGGDADAGATAMDEALVTLRGFPAAPWWNDRVQNCDDAELSAGRCVGIDGTTRITLAGDVGHTGEPVATEALPIAIRPPSDFTWRSDPHDVNGGGNARLNPGGGYYAAYWLGRFLEADTSATPNISPLSRARTAPRPPTDAGVIDAGTEASPDAGADAGVTPGSSGGCGCHIAARHAGSPWPALALLALLLGARRRRA